MSRLRDFWDRHHDELRAILNQVFWIVISLFLAVIVWIASTSESDPITQRDFPSRIKIRIINLDADVVLVNANDVLPTARVTIRAPEPTWNRLTEDNIIVQANAQHARSGEHVLPLQANLNLPGSVVDIEPSQIVVQLDVAGRRTIPVHIGLGGETAVGFEAGKPQADPTEVTVFGPASLVELVTEAYADFPLDGESANVESSLNLIARAQGQPVSNVQLEPPTVRVSVPILAREGFRTVAVLPNIQGLPPVGYTWQLETYNPQTITVTGAQNRLDNVTGVVLTDPIDLSDQTETFERELGVILPSGITPAAEQTITVRIAIEAIEGFREFDTVPIEANGLPPAYQALVTPDTVIVLVTGPRLRINALSADDVHAVVDLAGLAPDTYQLAPHVIIDREGISDEGVSVLPTIVEVRIINTAATATSTPQESTGRSDLGDHDTALPAPIRGR
jgi:YbbR domain-containing protein